MNNNHIMDWARKSGINFYTDGQHPSINDETIKVLEQFAQYSAKYERQLCAKICDRQAQDKSESEVWTGCASYLANQIRSRGKT